MDQLAQLASPFPPHAVKTRQQSGQTLLYISIDHVINRLNQVLEGGWSSEIRSNRLELHGEDGKGRSLYLAQSVVAIKATVNENESIREGVGAAVGLEPDAISKSALAEAFKKAATLFEVGLCMWSPAHRAYCTHLINYKQMDAKQVRKALEHAVKEWRSQDNSLQKFTTAQEANLCFLKQACLKEEEIEDLRARCQIPPEDDESKIA